MQNWYKWQYAIFMRVPLPRTTLPCIYVCVVVRVLVSPDPVSMNPPETGLPLFFATRRVRKNHPIPFSKNRWKPLASRHITTIQVAPRHRRTMTRAASWPRPPFASLILFLSVAVAVDIWCSKMWKHWQKIPSHQGPRKFTERVFGWQLEKLSSGSVRRS